MTRILTTARIVWLEMIRRKDLYVLLILLLTMLFVLMSLNIFGLGSVVRYVKDIGLLFAWLFSIVLAVNSAARQLPQEESKRTIYPLLAKPIRRGELIVGKWLGSWSITAVSTTAFYVLVSLIVKLRGGNIEMMTLLQAWLLHLGALGMITGIGLMFSTRMTYGAAASLSYIFVAAAFLVVPRVPTLVVHEEGFAMAGLLVLYYAFPHFELLDMRQCLVHEWGAAPWSVIGVVLAYAAVWVLLLLLLTWLGYRKKAFKRGAAL